MLQGRGVWGDEVSASRIVLIWEVLPVRWKFTWTQADLLGRRASWHHRSSASQRARRLLLVAQDRKNAERTTRIGENACVIIDIAIRAKCALASNARLHPPDLGFGVRHSF